MIIMNFKGIFRGSILAVCMSAITLFVCAVLVYFNILSEKTVSIIVFIAAMLGVFIGSLGVSRTSEHRIILNALSVAVTFCLVLLLISTIVNHGIEPHTRTLALGGGIICAAFLGAIFGK